MKEEMQLVKLSRGNLIRNVIHCLNFWRTMAKFSDSMDIGMMAWIRGNLSSFSS